MTSSDEVRNSVSNTSNATKKEMQQSKAEEANDSISQISDHDEAVAVTEEAEVNHNVSTNSQVDGIANTATPNNSSDNITEVANGEDTEGIPQAREPEEEKDTATAKDLSNANAKDTTIENMDEDVINEESVVNTTGDREKVSMIVIYIYTYICYTCYLL